VIALDTHLLVYAHQSDSDFHDQAKEAIESLRVKPAPWAIPWPCVHEFISVTTNPKIYKRPGTAAEPVKFLEALMDSVDLHFLAESEGYLEKLKLIVTGAKISGGRIHDARIAALCLHHGVRELWSADRDFSLFPQLKVRNPLIRMDD
jgi:toxin-antitoxin system PIN domain toxin